jgi:hypothetical protein
LLANGDIPAYAGESSLKEEAFVLVYSVQSGHACPPSLKPEDQFKSVSPCSNPLASLPPQPSSRFNREQGEGMQMKGEGSGFQRIQD